MPYMPRFTPIATIVILVCVAVYVVYNLMGTAWNVGGTILAELPGGGVGQVSQLAWWIDSLFAHNLIGQGSFWPWQPLTHAVMHGGVLHIVLNLLLFWYFASGVEERLGALRFGLVLLGGALGGAVAFQIFATHGVALGLSAVVTGVAVAFALILWRERVMIFLFMVPAWILVVIMIVLQDVVLGIMDPMKYADQTYLTHLMHLAGGLGGFITTLIVSDRARENLFGVRRKRTRAKQFRVIPPASEAGSTEPQSHDEEQLDRILAKVSREGVDALTADERAYLKKRSERR